MYPTHTACSERLASFLDAAIVRSINPATGATGYGCAKDLLGDHLDLTDLPTRAAVLTVLGAMGHPRPWMLGGMWSELTDEQAARCCVAMIEAVNRDVEPPICLMSDWASLGMGIPSPYDPRPSVGQMRFCRQHLAGDDGWGEYYLLPQRLASRSAPFGWSVSIGCQVYEGPEVGEDARERVNALLGVGGALLMGVDL